MLHMHEHDTAEDIPSNLPGSIFMDGKHTSVLCTHTLCFQGITSQVPLRLHCPTLSASWVMHVMTS